MILKTRLFTPGPTPLHPEVQEALARPIIHHRTDEFRAQFRAAREGAQRFLKTQNEVLLLSSSGTGAMEAAVVNLLSPGERMIPLVAGKFGERWAQLGKAHGMQVEPLCAPAGEAVAPEAVAAALKKHPDAKGVFVQLSESSTGVRHDIRGLGEVVAKHPDVLLVVDAISGAGAMALETDAWGVDVAIVGSQKALSLPPGLALMSVSEKAWQRVAASSSPRFYFDLRKERKAHKDEQTAFTPAISLIAALSAALGAMERNGGVDALVANAGMLAAMTRAAAGALGIPLLAPRDHGDALTALRPAEGLDAAAIVKGLKTEFRSTVAGGQDELKGKIFRVAHLGHYDVTDILGFLATLEIVLRRLGHSFSSGSGLAAAEEEYLRRTAK